MKAKPSSSRITDFSIEVPAKWVLSGEHSVLRGKSAIAFPYEPFTLKFSYRAAPQGALTITANPFQSQIKALLARAFEKLEIPTQAVSELHGEIEIESNIPIGAGLGSSAALCVAMARFVLWRFRPSIADLSAEWIRLATHLEDVIHGKSSGMDISTIVHAQGIEYKIGEPADLLSSLSSWPRFELYDSGKRGQTRECIEIVRHWQSQHPHLVSLLDEQMQEATRLGKKALLEGEKNPKEAEVELARAMELAQSCFETWGLVPTELMNQKYELLKQGALAVKLTGAGLGGFWVALWPRP